jgi:hypothetical protein
VAPAAMVTLRADAGLKFTAKSPPPEFWKVVVPLLKIMSLPALSVSELGEADGLSIKIAPLVEPSNRMSLVAKIETFVDPSVELIVVLVSVELAATV